MLGGSVTTVRDVGVHLNQSAASWPRMAWEAVRSGFRFNEMAARVAREDHSTPAEIVDKLGPFVEAGVQRIYLQVLDMSDLGHVEFFANEVVSQFS